MTAALRLVPRGALAPIDLRPYQRAAVDDTFAWIREKPGHPLIVIPTGGGKTHVMGALIREALAAHPGGRALVLAHRKELLQQNLRAIGKHLPLTRLGVYSAGLGKKDLDVDVLVAGIQSLGRKPFAAGAFDLVLIDEAHLVPRSEDTLYQATIDALKKLNPAVVFIGLTATPYRLDSGRLDRGEDALFTDIAYEAAIPDLIAGGYLCPLVSRATSTRLSVDGVGTRGGEFIPGALERAVNIDALTQAIVAELVLRAGARHHWVLFCAGVAHAEAVAEALTQLDIPATAVHGGLNATERAERLADFHTGRLRCLTSVDVLTTGWDEPAIDLIALLRPTKSAGLYSQMVGRGFRLHPSKTDTLVLDFAGNVARHGPVDAIVVRDKTTGSATGTTAPVKDCPDCQNYVPASVRICPECQHEFPKPDPLANIFGQASTLPILTTEAEPSVVPVDGASYSRHEKPGKPASLRVDYYDGMRRVVSEWVCLEHTGFAKQKADAWWRARAGWEKPVPATVAEALERTSELPEPRTVTTLPEGQYLRVVAVTFLQDDAESEAASEEAPRACETCAAYAGKGFCTTWQDTVPSDYLVTGCDRHEESELPF